MCATAWAHQTERQLQCLDEVDGVYRSIVYFCLIQQYDPVGVSAALTVASPSALIFG